MKNIITLVVIAITLFACAVPQKALYELPEAMSETVKADFKKQCDKGQILYEINCARCHTQMVKGKKLIPDFSPDQLIGYELRVKNAKHESEMSEASVTAEELGLIMTFLSYKKKSTSIAKL